MAEFARSELDSVLRRALELSADERQRFLDDTCDRDTDLRRAVERMLEDCEGDDLLLQPGGGASGPLWDALARDYAPAAFAFEPGERVGAYRVVRILGRGGMATVYLAERADGQFEQAVALKVLDVGRDFDGLLARFAQERRILARLEHPNIARLIDGGVTRTGQSYVVMEYVDGEAIDQYCDCRRLGVDERIKLFAEVANAVQYAHGYLIVHRDIKPSNILVNANGEPKLLDFGIAKLLNADSAAPVTRSALHPMTPEYASPEQVRGEPPTTASDVYQLGYLLYYLLTGRAAYSADRRNVAAMVHAICNIEPARASSSVTSSPEASDVDAVREASIARATTPERLRRRLSGDIDNILRTALCKHPEGRYPSVVHLCEDLRRHLKGLPVSARPPTLRYRGGKFVRRHRAGVLATVLVSLAIVSGLAATAWQARATAREAARAEQQAEIATAVIDYLNKDMIAAANPAASNAADLTVAEVLDAAAASAHDRFAGRPRVEAAIRLTLGETYFGLGNLEAAESELAASLALLEEDGGGSEAEAIRARLQLSDVLIFDARFDGARGLLDDVLRIVTLDDDAQTWFHAHGRQAGLMRMQGDAPGSLQRLEELLPLAIAELGAAHETTQEIQEMLGGALNVSGRAEEAIEVFAAAIEAAVDRFGERHVAALRPRMNLAGALRKAGRLEEAIAPMEMGLEGYKVVLGDEHVQTLWAMHITGLLYADLRRYDEAAAMFRQAAEGRARLWGADHPATLASQTELERVSLASGDATSASSN